MRRKTRCEAINSSAHGVEDTNVSSIRSAESRSEVIEHLLISRPHYRFVFTLHIFTHSPSVVSLRGCITLVSMRISNDETSMAFGESLMRRALRTPRSRASR